MLSVLILAATAAPAGAGEVTAADVAEIHTHHGHHQYRHGHGDRGHRWSDYRREARHLNAYFRAVALGRLARCSRDPHCAVQLASFLTRAPWGLVSRVVQCESGWDPGADNSMSSAGGLFQFLESTWASLSPGWGMGGHSRYEVWPAAVVGSGTIAQGGIGHWRASQGCWS